MQSTTSATALQGGLDKDKLPTHLKNIRDLGKKCPRFKEIFGDDFYVVDTFGKGSCFFHSVAEAVCPEYDWIGNSRERESLGLRLRKSFLKYSNEQLYKEAMDVTMERLQRLRQKSAKAPSMSDIPSYAVFQRKLGTPSVWADLVLISYISHIFNMNLVFFDDAACELYYGASRFDAKADFPTIFINWHSHRHFELIVRIDEESGRIERQFFYPKHKNIIDRVAEAYNGAGRA
jgi:hypothetical protein